MMRFAMVALALAGCGWSPCPTEGEIFVTAVDQDGAEVCLVEAEATDGSGSWYPGDCVDCACTIATQTDVEHRVVGTTDGGATAEGTASLVVFERCNFPTDSVELVFAAAE